MALAFVQRKNNNSQVGTTALTTGNMTSNPTAGNLLIVLVQVQRLGDGPTVTSVTDTWGNTYVATTGSPVNHTGAINHEWIWYAKNISGSGVNNVTANFDNATTYTTVTVYEVSGADTTSPFVTDSKDAQASGTSIQTGTLSLGGLNCFIVAILESDGAGATATPPTPNTGYTQFANDASGYLFDEYHITSTNESAGGTVTTSTSWSIIAAAFKEAAGGSIATSPHLSTKVIQAVNRAGTF